MRTLNIWVFLFIVSIISCNDSYIIPKKDMVSILVKICITDATVVQSNLRNTYFNRDTINYYGKTIESYGYTSPQFDSSLNYYAKEPKQLDAIYDKVIFELSKIQTDLIQESKDFPRLNGNSSRIETYGNLPIDSLQYFVNLDLPVVGLGSRSIAYEVQLFNDEESDDPQPKNYFYNDSKTNKGTILYFIAIPYSEDGVETFISTQQEQKKYSKKTAVSDKESPVSKPKSRANVSDTKLKSKPSPARKINKPKKEKVDRVKADQ